MTKELRKREIASKMKNARIAAKLTQAQVADKLGLTYQAVSNYERGRNGIEGDLLVKLCDIYSVDPRAILSDLYECPICGLFYDSSEESDVDEHNYLHERFVSALKHYGVCYNPHECAKIKSDSYETLHSDDDESAKREAALNLIKVYFSRSLAANKYTLNHPQFKSYAAMILNQNYWVDVFGKTIHDSLVREYGKSPGLSEKRTTCKISENNGTHISSCPSVTNEAQEVAQRYDALDQIGKGAVMAIMNYEEQRMLNPSLGYVMDVAARNGERKKITITKKQADEALRLLDELPENEDF